jgi:hypothetical protein
MEATAFLLSPDELGDRFGVTGTIFLAAVAFYFVTAEQVPKVSYSTQQNKFRRSLTQHVAMFGTQSTSQ